MQHCNLSAVAMSCPYVNSHLPFPFFHSFASLSLSLSPSPQSADRIYELPTQEEQDEAAAKATKIWNRLLKVRADPTAHLSTLSLSRSPDWVVSVAHLYISPCPSLRGTFLASLPLCHTSDA